MKITLINVQISEGNNIVPPLGILYIASVLERMGHELQVFDIDPDVTLWIVPFLCFYPNYAWILLTGLIMLSYHVLIRYMADGIWMENMWIKTAIYIPFYALLITDGWRIWQARNTQSVIQR